MWDKLKNDKYVKDLLVKLLTILFVAAIALLLFDVLTQSKDGRRQIVDMNGGSEVTQATALATDEEIRLKEILSQLKGVGDTDVMITYRYEAKTDTVFSSSSSGKNDRKVAGVIVACEGAGDIIIKNNIINAVATVFDIPASNVVVFEKSNSGTK